MSENSIADLLKKHLQGNISPEDRHILEQWVAQDPAYRELFDRLNSREDLLEDLKALHITPIDTMRTRAHILGNESVRLRRPIRRWLPYVAAAMVLMLLSIGYFTLVYQQAPLRTHNSAADIVPGGNRATLTLTDGRRISLDESQNGIVIGEESISYVDGTAVFDESSGAEDHSRGSNNSYYVLSTPRGGTYQVSLPDGSKVWLNAGSTLKYPSRFAVSERVVMLDGEAYFEVTKQKVATTNKSVQVPFLVVTAGQTVEVLGTAFNLSSYTDDPDTKTTLIEGKVQVSPGARGRTATARVLNPGQQAIVRGASIQTMDVDVDQHIAWRRGYFDFTGKNFTEVMRELGRWYDLDIVYKGKVPVIQFYGDIERNSDFSIVKNLLESNGISFRLEGGKRLIILGKEGTPKD